MVLFVVISSGEITTSRKVVRVMLVRVFTHVMEGGGIPKDSQVKKMRSTEELFTMISVGKTVVFGGSVVRTEMP